ncbi:MAG: sulfotransferase domain-containing protein [Verrucomicrobiae bacterium]|nr:sulfotransferase domain-containing protein [Verrucomicrobiae bacterium]
MPLLATRINFLIVGTQKGGTTALADFLSQHPEICLAPQKEVHFFDSPQFQDATTVEEWQRNYSKAFPNHQSQTLIGEATPIYMYWPQIAQRIHRYNPNIKLIFLLRDPLQRAISHYRMELQRGNETLSFTQACIAEPFRLFKDRNNLSETSSLRLHSYLHRGFYRKQIERFRQFFPDSQILILKNESLLQQHELTLKKIYYFLGINDTAFIPKSKIIFSHDQAVSLNPFFKKILQLLLKKEIAYYQTF